MSIEPCDRLDGARVIARPALLVANASDTETHRTVPKPSASFTVADIDRVFVSVIVSCRFAITVVDQLLAQPHRHRICQPLRLYIGGNLQTAWPDLVADPWLRLVGLLVGCILLPSLIAAAARGTEQNGYVRRPANIYAAFMSARPKFRACWAEWELTFLQRRGAS